MIAHDDMDLSVHRVGHPISPQDLPGSSVLAHAETGAKVATAVGTDDSTGRPENRNLSLGVDQGWQNVIFATLAVATSRGIVKDDPPHGIGANWEVG